MDIFRVGAVKVRSSSEIKKGLLYQDDRDKVARVFDYFEGLVVLDWLSSGKQSQCSERNFIKRFYLYGRGHIRPIPSKSVK